MNTKCYDKHDALDVTSKNSDRKKKEKKNYHKPTITVVSLYADQVLNTCNKLGPATLPDPCAAGVEFS